MKSVNFIVYKLRAPNGDFFRVVSIREPYNLYHKRFLSANEIEIIGPAAHANYLSEIEDEFQVHYGIIWKQLVEHIKDLKSIRPEEFI